MDWDTCQGKLAKVPWDAKRYFNHYVYWDYSTNAQMGGLFVHMVDVVHWYLKVEKPLAAICMGGIYLGVEGRDTADNINSIVEYPGGLLVTFEANVTDMISKENADIVFMGTGGRLHIFRYGYRFLPAEKGAEEITSGPTPELHVANWLDCVRSRKQAACDEAAGHYSAMACHIAQHRLSRETPSDVEEGVGYMSIEPGLNMEFVRRSEKALSGWRRDGRRRSATSTWSRCSTPAGN